MRTRTPRPALTLAITLVAALLMTLRAPIDAQSGNRERTLYVSAVNDKGEPVEGLGPEAFTVREDGVRREVLRVSKAIEPIDIAILADTSAAARNAITFIRDGVSKFIARMAAGNDIALIGLADRPTILVDYTRDQKRLKDGVGRLFAMSGSGMTLLDAVYETSRGLERRETPRAAIVAVFTDGIEYTNRYAKDVAAEARKAEASVHLVGIGRFLHNDNDQGIRERSFLLDEAPRATGGQYDMVLSEIGVPDAMDKIARELANQYKVVYGHPESLIPPEKIEVSSSRDGVTMRGTPARGEKTANGGA